MAVNLELIKRRIQEMTGQRRTSSVQLWKPTVGEYRVRGLPWPSSLVADGMPLLERWFYYLGNSPRFLAPDQFKKPDPVNDLRRKLYATKKPEDREIAKKLQSKMTAYMPIVVRSQEDKDVQVWAFNTFIHQRLLGFFVDEDVGDFLDPENGFDLKVTVTESKKRFNDKPVMDIVIDPARKSSKLSDDPAQAKKWLESIPNVDDMYPQKTAQEIEQALNAWLAGDPTPEEVKSDGTSRGGPSSGKKDDLDKIVDEVKTAAPKTTPKGKTTAPAADVDLGDGGAASAGATKSALDDAFDELLLEQKT